MKVLKSPVFYFGIILLLAVSLALLAPFIIDWGRYREGLEGWGQKLTGREVAIRGGIHVRLFPFPQLTADDVVIANPDGFREPVFASIERVRVQVTLGGLINGDLQVESIDIERPVVNLVRLQDNSVNAHFTPAVAVRNSPLLDQVQLDQIKVLDGTVYLKDEVRATKTVLTDIGATVSAPTLAGPWRSAGAFKANGAPLSFSLSSATWDAQKPLRFSLRLSPAEQAGYTAIIDGESALDGMVKGVVRVTPAVDEEGKSDSEGRFRSVTVKADYSATFNRIDLSEIEIRPADSSDQGTLITGKASAAIGKQVNASIDISAPRVDLDVLAGAGSRQLLRNGGGLALINGLLAGLPSDLQLGARVKVLALRAGGEVLENTEIAFETSKDSVRISRFTANLPGRSRALFSGVFFPGDRFAELGGNLSVESYDTRQLAGWLWPESKAEMARIWTGNRGRLKASSEVRLTASKLEFRNLAYELNGDAGKGRIAMLVNGERPILDLELKAGRLDIDSLLPGGVGSLSPTSGMRWTWLLQNFLDEQSRRDMRLVFDAERLVLNGVEAENVSASLETTVRGIDLKTLSIASVGGAKLEASGVVLNTDAGADGDIGMRIAAEDPRGLLRLAGLIPRGRDPAWAQPLRRTDMNISLQARVGNAPGSIGIAVRGSSGPFAIKADGALSALPAGNLTVKGTASVSSPNSADLWQLFAGEQQPADGRPARLSVSVDGSGLAGFKLTSSAELYGLSLSFAGTGNPFAAAPAAEGRLELAAEDVRTVARVGGMPLVDGEALSLSASATLKRDATQTSLEQLSGKLGGEPFSGALTLQQTGILAGELTVARLSLAQGLAATFLPWNGQSASLESLFAAQAPFGLTGELWVRPKILDVYPGYSVPDGQIGITASESATQFVAYGKSSNGEKVAVELKLDTALAQRKLSGSIALPFHLAAVLEQADGERPIDGVASIDVKVEGQGLSPAAVLVDLKGSGPFQLTGGALRDISPERFTQTIASVRDADGLQASLAAMRDGDGLQLSPVFGSVDIRQGVATVTPLTLTTADAAATISPVVDLATGNLRLSVTLDLKAMPGLPRMAVVYEGPPGKLQRRDDVNELNAFLGFKVLQQGVDELEKMQAEQARLAREEEEMRKQDQAKLEQFYAQRTELRLRQRELRTFAAQRIVDAERAAARQAELIAQVRQLNRDELARRLRELVVFGRPIAPAGAVLPPIKPRSKPKLQLPVEGLPEAPVLGPG